MAPPVGDRKQQGNFPQVAHRRPEDTKQKENLPQVRPEDAKRKEDPNPRQFWGSTVGGPSRVAVGRGHQPPRRHNEEKKQ